MSISISLIDVWQIIRWLWKKGETFKHVPSHVESRLICEVIKFSCNWRLLDCFCLHYLYCFCCLDDFAGILVIWHNRFFWKRKSNPSRKEREYGGESLVRSKGQWQSMWIDISICKLLSNQIKSKFQDLSPSIFSRKKSHFSVLLNSWIQCFLHQHSLREFVCSSLCVMISSTRIQ